MSVEAGCDCFALMLHWFVWPLLHCLPNVWIPVNADLARRKCCCGNAGDTEHTILFNKVAATVVDVKLLRQGPAMMLRRTGYNAILRSARSIRGPARCLVMASGEGPTRSRSRAMAWSHRCANQQRVDSRTGAVVVGQCMCVASASGRLCHESHRQLAAS